MKLRDRSFDAKAYATRFVMDHNKKALRYEGFLVFSRNESGYVNACSRS